MKKLFKDAESLRYEKVFEELTPIYKDANCTNCPTEWFFPPDGRGKTSVAPGSNLFNAFSVCAECKVKEQCFTFAKRYRCIGVWGGKLFTASGRVSPLKIKGT